MAGRRRLAVAVVAIAAGAGLVLLGASRTWWVETVLQPAPLRPQELVHTGASLAPVLPALGFVAAKLQAEPSGDDRTLFAARLPDFRVPAEATVLATDGEGRYLLEMAGFDAQPPAEGQWLKLGCYAAPLVLPDGPSAGDHA